MDQRACASPTASASAVLRRCWRTAARSFQRRFWNEAAGCLYDVVDVDHVAGHRRLDAPPEPDPRGRRASVSARSRASARGESSTRSRRASSTPLGLRTLAREHPGLPSALRRRRLAARRRLPPGHGLAVAAGRVRRGVGTRARRQRARRSARRAGASWRRCSPTSTRRASHVSEVADGDAAAHAGRLPVPGVVGGRAVAHRPRDPGGGSGRRGSEGRDAGTEGGARLRRKAGSRSRAHPPRRRTASGRRTGSAGDRTSPSASGGRCARTTARTGTAWDYFPHDHARSRAYRWGEDGLLGISDRHQYVCFALALWNGRDPDPEGAALRPDRHRGQPRRGRQGVLLLPRLDADALLHEGALQVPAARVPVRSGCSTRTARARQADPEFELIDTGVFDDDRYFDVFVEYAKAGPDDILIRITRRQPRARGRRRCTCCRRSGSATPGPGASATRRQRLRAGEAHRAARTIDVDSESYGRLAARSATARPSCSSRRTRPTPQRLCGAENDVART